MAAYLKSYRWIDNNVCFVCVHRAARATKQGHFKAEIIPVTVEVEDKNGEKRTITVGCPYHKDCL